MKDYHDMTKYELFEYFHQKPDPDKSGYLKKEKFFKKHFSEIYEDFLKFEFFDDLKNGCFVQKLWHYMQDDPGNFGYCKECGKRLEFKSFTYGYYDFCSTKCSNRNKETNQKRKDTCIKNHGGYGLAAKDIHDQFKKTMKERHGAEYSGYCKKIQDKINKSNFENNDGIGFASKKVCAKFNKTMNDTYGVDWAGQSDEIRRKQSNTVFENFKKNIHLLFIMKMKEHLFVNAQILFVINAKKKHSKYTTVQ